jgi:hypothetical protein
VAILKTFRISYPLSELLYAIFFINTPPDTLII